MSRKNLRGYRVGIVLLTVAFVFCSLFPCINRFERNVPEGVFVYESGYPEPDSMPYLILFSWPLALAELVLILASRRRSAWIAGFILNLAKTALPLPLSILLDRLSSGGGDGRYLFALAPFGFFIFFFGFFIALMHLGAIFSRQRE